MTSEPRRDPLADHLITPENSVLVVVDYQQEMLNNVRSVDHAQLSNAMTGVVRTAKAFGVPTIFSTVAVERASTRRRSSRSAASCRTRPRTTAHR